MSSVNRPRWVAIPIASTSTCRNGGASGTTVTSPSKLPRNGVGRTWNIDPGPMALGAPRATKAGTANPGPNAWPGGFMGGGSHGKRGDVQYAHAVPPSWKAGTMLVLVQRAYFSAWR